jgi:hypothetical protein
MNCKNIRLIDTNLTGDTMFHVCAAVVGQLSDGIWENSPAMEKYWRNLYVRKNPDGKILIEVNADTCIDSWRKTLDNPFHKMDDFQIKYWFADKIKQIVKIEQKDSGQKNFWKRDCVRDLDYMDATVRDAYYAYDVLKERNIEGKY